MCVLQLRTTSYADAGFLSVDVYVAHAKKKDEKHIRARHVHPLRHFAKVSCFNFFFKSLSVAQTPAAKHAQAHIYVAPVGFSTLVEKFSIIGKIYVRFISGCTTIRMQRKFSAEDFHFKTEISSVTYFD